MSTAAWELTNAGVLDAPTLVAATAPVRVLHLINGEHYSGAERVQDQLALNLGRYGYAVGFGCLKPGRFDQARQAREAPWSGCRCAAVSTCDRRGNWRIWCASSPTR